MKDTDVMLNLEIKEYYEEENTEKYKGKYMLHGFYPYSRMRNVTIKEHLMVCNEFGTKLVTTNNTKDALEKLKQENLR